MVLQAPDLAKLMHFEGGAEWCGQIVDRVLSLQEHSGRRGGKVTAVLLGSSKPFETYLSLLAA